MSLAFLKKAFGLRKSSDERNFEEFLKTFNSDSFVNISYLTKTYKKNALRLIIIQNSSDSLIYDSYSCKDNNQLPKFVKNNKTLTLVEAAFGSFSFNKDSEITSSMKMHDFSSNNQLLFSCTYNLFPKPAELRTGDSSFPNRRNSLNLSIYQPVTRSCHPGVTLERSIAICLLINLEWATSLSKMSTVNQQSLTKTEAINHSSSGHLSNSTKSLNETPSSGLIKRFYFLIFEHFLQINNMLDIMVQDIMRLLCSNLPPRTTSKLSSRGQLVSTARNLAIHERIDAIFQPFLQSMSDLCIPRLARPVWPVLSLSLAMRPDELECLNQMADPAVYKKSYKNVGSNPVPHIDPTTYQTQHDIFTNNFVRGCLGQQISKAIARDKANFLGQLLTAVLVYHNGWISTVIPEETDYNFAPSSSSRGVCEAVSARIKSCMASSNFPPFAASNLLLEQLLTQFGCSLTKHACDDAPFLNTSGNLFSTTVICGQQRDRLLALLYIISYFIRAPSLLKSRERLPDLGSMDLYELKQRRKRLRHGNKSHRKSGSLINSGTGAKFNRAFAFNDPHDSGISSQEDLTSALFSVSAGSSPSHVSSMAVCLPHRLTQDQCRVAEAVAYLVVNRELAAANMTPGNQQTLGRCQMVNVPPAYFSERRVTGGATWTASRNPTCPFFYPGLGRIPASNSSFASISPLGLSLRPPQITEVPLLIEKSFDYTEEACLCSGPCLSQSLYGLQHSPPSSYRPVRPADIGQATGCSAGRQSSGHISILTEAAARAGVLGSVDTMDGQVVCISDLYETDDRPDLNLAFHCQVGSSVFEQYTSGLALQATLEAPVAFRGRLETELKAWLQCAPALLQSIISANNRMPQVDIRHRFDTTTNSGASVYDRAQTYSAFTASAVVANLDASSVEVITVQHRSQNVLDSTLSGSRASLASTTNIQVAPAETEFLSSHSAGLRAPRRVTIDEEASEDSLLAPAPQFETTTMKIKSSPSLVRLLASVKALTDHIGCPNIAMRHLEAGLQLLYRQSCTISQLLISEGPQVLMNPSRMAATVGCQCGDLPLLLSIVPFHSCKGAAIIRSFPTDWRSIF